MVERVFADFWKNTGLCKGVLVRILASLAGLTGCLRFPGWHRQEFSE